MNDVAEAAKNNPGLSAVVIAMILGGGGAVWSEGAEEEETNQFTAEFRQADVEQDKRDDELDDMFHDLDKRLALVEKELEDE